MRVSIEAIERSWARTADGANPADERNVGRGRLDESEASGTLVHVDAFDGLRALAVLAVLGFHGGVSWLAGGFLGVTAFFTLSGFLITSLLLSGAVGRQRNGSSPVALRGFWTRRVRRLLPASLAGIVLAVVVTVSIGDVGQQPKLRGDVAASLADVANWRFLASGQSYADLFKAPSALEHYWSLAIEEQCYLLLPLLVFGAILVGQKLAVRRITTIPAIVLSVALGASVVSTFVNAGNYDRVYYGTDTRAAEVLVGCLLAVVIHRLGGFAVVTGLAGRGRQTLEVIGIGAIAAFVFFWSSLESGDPIVATGGLVAMALVSAVLIPAALAPGHIRRALSVRPLTAVGRVSYGVYVYHWPIFVFALAVGPDLAEPVRLALCVAATFALAALSYRYLEQPIRTGRRLPWLPVPSRYPALATVMILAVVCIRLPMAVPSPDQPIDYAATETAFRDELLNTEPIAATPPGSAVPVAPVTTPTRFEAPEDPPAPWISLFGDQKALETSYAMSGWLNGRPDAHYADSHTSAWCSLLRGTVVRDVNGTHGNEPSCDQRDSSWGQVRDAGRADVAIIQIGSQDLYPRDFGGDDWRTIGDPVFDQRISSELDEVIALFGDKSAVILFSLPADWNALGPTRPWLLDAASYRVRATRFNQLLSEAAARHQDRTAMFDFDKWLERAGGAQALWPDGLKTDAKVGAALTQALTTSALDLFQRVWRAAHPPRAIPDAPEGSTPAVGSSRPPRILVAGDSTALAIAVGMHGYAERTSSFKVASIARSGCGFVRNARTRGQGNDTASCPDWKPVIDDAVAQFRPDTALVVDARVELEDHKWQGEPTWRGIGDPTYEQRLANELSAAFDALHAGGATVALVLYPHLDLARFNPKGPADPSGEWWRMDRYNQILKTVANMKPFVKILDLAAFARTFPNGEMDPTMRPDGVHLTSPAAEHVVDAWLADQLRSLGTNPSNEAG